MSCTTSVSPNFSARRQLCWPTGSHRALHLHHGGSKFVHVRELRQSLGSARAFSLSLIGRFRTLDVPVFHGYEVFAPMDTLSTIRFDLRPRPDLGEAVEVVPVVNAVPLADLVHAFEKESSFETREDSYAGLIPAHFKFGPLDQHFLGTGTGKEPGSKTPLLGCECGEWGCLPFLARVEMNDTTVVWSEFEQPFRKERDYRSFGPFQFDRADYERGCSPVTGSNSVRRSISSSREEHLHHGGSKIVHVLEPFHPSRRTN